MTPLLHSIAWDLGDAHPLDTLSGKIDATKLAELSAEGMQSYCKSAMGPAQHARSAAQRSLERAGLSASDIDHLFICSNVLESSGWTCVNALAEIGFRFIPTTGVTLHGCAGLLAATDLALGYVSRHPRSHCLIVCTDAASDDAKRLTMFGAALLSDGAAACIVSDRVARGWAIEGLGQTVDHRTRMVDPEQGAPLRTALTVRSLARAVDIAISGAGFARSDIDAIVATNLKPSVMSALLAAVKLDATRYRWPSLPNAAHVFASDPLLNLEQIPAELGSHCRPVLVVGMSFHCSNVAVLTRRDG